jgi:tetratricopeptide (TPR) repeat protein
MLRRTFGKGVDTGVTRALMKRVYEEEGIPIGRTFEEQYNKSPVWHALQCPNKCAAVIIYFGEEPPGSCPKCGRRLGPSDFVDAFARGSIDPELKRATALEAHVLFATECHRKGDTAAAELHLSKALTLGASGEEAEWLKHNRAEARIELGDIRGAIDDCDDALRINPRAADTLLTRGAAKAMLGDYVGCIKDTDAALSLGLDNPIAYFNRGQSLAILGNLPRAHEDLRAFLKLAPRDPRAPQVREYLNALNP